MGSSRFALEITVRAALLFATLVVLAYVVSVTSLVAVAAIVGALVLVQAYLLTRYVHRTNRELARLLDAIRYDDFQQSFSVGELGATFADLEATFDEVMQRFRQARLERE